jgi:hypothetical protein
MNENFRGKTRATRSFRQIRQPGVRALLASVEPVSTRFDFSSSLLRLAQNSRIYRARPFGSSKRNEPL